MTTRLPTYFKIIKPFSINSFMLHMQLFVFQKHAMMSPRNRLGGFYYGKNYIKNMNVDE